MNLLQISNAITQKVIKSPRKNKTPKKQSISQNLSKIIGLSIIKLAPFTETGKNVLIWAN